MKLQALWRGAASVALSLVLLAGQAPAARAASPAAVPVNVSTKAGLTVHCIDVGQADCILVQLPNGQVMLIDGGSEADAGAVRKYLTAQGVKTIDYLVATHPREDHIGGLPAVLDSYNVGQVYLPKATTTSETNKKLLAAIKDKGLKTTTAKAGVSILGTDDLRIDILAPVKDSYDELNNYSAVVKLTYKSTSFLFAGDAGTLSEGQITADIKADVLKVGNHGSDTSTSAAFLAKVSPKMAAISCGKGSDNDHPDDSVLKSLRDAGVAVYRTDTVGTVVFTSDGTAVMANKSPTPYQPGAPPASKAATPKADSSKAQGGTASTVEEPSASSAADVQSATVYVTRTGAKYHRDGCQYLRQSKIAISLADAKQSYTACSKCSPPQ